MFLSCKTPYELLHDLDWRLYFRSRNLLKFRCRSAPYLRRVSTRDHRVGPEVGGMMPTDLARMSDANVLMSTARVDDA